MSTKSRPSNVNQSLIRYRFVLLEGESFKLTNVGQPQDQFNTSSSPDSRGIEKSTSKVSTTRLLSAVGNVWQHFFLPSTFHPEAKREQSGSQSSIDNKGLKVTNIGCLLSEQVSVEIAKHQSKISQRRLLFDPPCGLAKNLSAWTGNNCFATDSCRTRALEIFYELESIYEPIIKSLLPEIVKKKSYPGIRQITSKYMTRSLSFDTNDSEFMSSESTSLSHDATAEDAFSRDERDAAESRKKPCDSLQSSYLLGLTHSVDHKVCLSRTFKSTLYSDYCIDFVSVNNCVSGAESFCINAENLEQVCEVVDKNSHEHQVKEVQSFFFENMSMTNMWCHMHGKALDVFAKHRYAIAGALAGVFVSLCLHPFDTVKTVLQARALDQSVYRVAESILSERGVMGLYRGIASNIASSAPISGLYTYTYESMKSLLLPLFPKEHHSFVYCMAGGCASIATSFIFTPSERIKQQMQVRALYSNCWNALIGIFEKGGLISLYTGWGAVLCRNIPHSIIKFYTYEKLKKLMKFSAESIGHSDTLQTLICGGLAGCTAAFFTTPFDVVKTKLQTQGPDAEVGYVCFPRCPLFCFIRVLQRCIFYKSFHSLNGLLRFAQAGSDIPLTILHSTILLPIKVPWIKQTLAPFPIGFAALLVYLATIPITGTGINPARSLGAAVIQKNGKAWDGMRVFSVRPVIGAAFAAITTTRL